MSSACGQAKPASTQCCKIKAANLVGFAGFFACVAALIAAFFPHGKILNPVDIVQDPALAKPNAENPDNWEYFGRNGNGTRFAPYTDITPENVKDLKVAWTYHTGRDTSAGVDENTPIQIGSTLYSCTPTNIISAIDGDSGKALWKYDPHAKLQSISLAVVLVTMMQLKTNL